MPAQDISLAQLKTFLRIVERGSLSAAAKDLKTTQPTVSRQLKDLEAAYEAVLLVRTTRSLHLTDAGKRVYELAQTVVLSDDTLREQLSGSRTLIEGPIRVSAPSGFGSLVIAPFCGRFVERHPRVSIDLCLSDARIDLVSEGIDIAVRVGRLSDSSLYARPLAVLDEVLVGHPRFLARTIAQPADLLALPWVVFSGLQDSNDVCFERFGQRQIVKVVPRLKIDQIIGLHQALLAGAGVGLIHRYAVAADIQAGRLVQLLPEWELPQWPVHALFPMKTLAERARRWLEALQQEMASVPGASMA